MLKKYQIIALFVFVFSLSLSVFAQNKYLKATTSFWTHRKLKKVRLARFAMRRQIQILQFPILILQLR